MRNQPLPSDRAQRNALLVLLAAWLVAPVTACSLAAGPVNAAEPPPTLAATNRSGRRSFLQCRSCHALTGNAPHLIGPSLEGLFGRRAGALPGFAFSDALSQSNVQWDAQTLRGWLSDPAAFLPGNRMAFEGVDDDAELDALIQFLKAETTVD